MLLNEMNILKGVIIKFTPEQIKYLTGKDGCANYDCNIYIYWNNLLCIKNEDDTFTTLGYVKMPELVNGESESTIVDMLKQI